MKKIILLLFLMMVPLRVLATSSVVVTTSTTTEPVAHDSYFRGHVEKIVSESTNQEFGDVVIEQRVELVIDSGSESGKKISVDYQARGSEAEARKLKSGQKVVVDKNETPDATNYFVTEVYRLPAIAWFAAAFFLLTLLLTGRRGFMAFVGLAVTMAVLGWYIIPQISNGGNPFVVSLVGTCIIASSSLFLAHGFNRRTGLAFVSSMITIGVSLVVSVLAVKAAHLFGLGSEEAYYLQFAPLGTINMQGLLLGGIIIGVMGLLDDVTTAQVTAVAELKNANPALTARELYKGGSAVGREHILSLVNTLVLAYVGASFPLLLLFTAYSTPWWVTMNTELISEELVRTIIGSLALIMAVPLTTVIAAYSFHHSKNSRV